MPEPFDPEAFRAALAGVPFARRVVARVETGSTNNDAAREARAGAPEGTVVVADRQTGGRGRLGRTWIAAPGEALLASWVVRPVLPVDRWPSLTLFAALAAVEGVERACGIAAGIKWPNDLFAGEPAGKIAGILAEADVAGGFVVIGIGLNVSGDLAPEIRGTATTVAAAGGSGLARPPILAEVLRAFSGALAGPAAALDGFRARCATLGTVVRVERAGAPAIEGLARDVDARGALLISSAGGEVVVAAGDVTHLRPAPAAES
ncbi:MAG: biotin--[acetyl-CoA-carboxylase] ligase [Acidobacteria bacterium]|nr:biotin--[acetyl-CoA-carboxylase] ligase [Acidobacteriota bacterium]